MSELGSASVEALRTQYPEEWAEAEGEDTPEAAERVARMPIDFSRLPRLSRVA